MSKKYQEYLKSIGMNEYTNFFLQGGIPLEVVHQKVKKEIQKMGDEISSERTEHFLSKIGYSDDIQAQEFVKSAALGNIKQCLLMIEKGININVNTVDGTALIQPLSAA